MSIHCLSMYSVYDRNLYEHWEDENQESLNRTNNNEGNYCLSIEKVVQRKIRVSLSLSIEQMKLITNSFWSIDRRAHCLIAMATPLYPNIFRICSEYLCCAHFNRFPFTLQLQSHRFVCPIRSQAYFRLSFLLWLNKFVRHIFLMLGNEGIW